MADFCKQCGLEAWGEDNGDLAGLLSGEDAGQDFVAFALCEGCGPIPVRQSGECISPDCLKQHGVLAPMDSSTGTLPTDNS